VVSLQGKAPAKDEDEPLDYYDDDDLEEEDVRPRPTTVVGSCLCLAGRSTPAHVLIAAVTVVPLAWQYYFRTHRVVLGNRRFGAGGFVGNGRQQARTVVPKVSVRHGGGGSSSSTSASASSSASAAKERTLPPPKSKKAAERAAKAEAKASKEKARKDAAMSSKRGAAAGGKAPGAHTDATAPDAT